MIWLCSVQTSWGSEQSLIHKDVGRGEADNSSPFTPPTASLSLHSPWSQEATAHRSLLQKALPCTPHVGLPWCRGEDPGTQAHLEGMEAGRSKV